MFHFLEEDINEINLSLGLKNTAGNEKLYVQLLKIFKQRLDQNGPQVNYLLSLNSISNIQIHQAYEFVHNLKGISVSLGAEGLSESCVELCRILGEDDINQSVALKKALYRFNQQVKVLQSSLGKI